MAADLTAAQAAELAKQSTVLGLTKDELAHPDTTLSPHFLGLDAAGGVWSQLGGGPKAGAGVVVGVIDTGIWPESTAFAGKTGIPVPSDWHGVCQAGELWPVTTCNDKLVGARYYLSGFGIKNIATDNYVSARDGEGHGSHTASTAAGNYGTDVTIDGNKIGTGAGMAPGAKVAMYKVCWTGRKGLQPGCFNSDSVAAINDAVARRRGRPELLDRRHDGVEPARRRRAGVPRRVERRCVRGELRRQQRPGGEHARPSGSVGDDGRRLDVPPGVPGRSSSATVHATSARRRRRH